MKISTRVRYGTRVMLELALAQGKGPIRVKDIAKTQELSLKYIEHLIASLKAAGLVRARRGARGGYVVAKSPSQITLLEIFRLLEGPVSIVDCIEDPKCCNRSKLCVTRQVWKQASEAMTKVLSGITLEDLAERQRNGGAANATYNI